MTINNIKDNNFDPSEMVSLEYSSQSAISNAASAVSVPSKIFAEVKNASHTLEELENINFYTKYTSALGFAGFEPQTFEEAIDEVQYIANIMLTEAMKHEFISNYNYIASQMGEAIYPNQQILGLADTNDSVWQVIARHQMYITEIMPEYVSQMLQSVFQDESQLSNLSRGERQQLNSWDMYGILKNISQEKESEQFNALIGDFYNIAVDFATTSGADKLSYYKKMDPSKWVRDLYASVLQDDKIEARMDSMNIENERYVENQHNTISLASAARILNSQNSPGLSDDGLKRFEDTMYNICVLSTSLSTKWGTGSEEYSAVNNRQLITETIDRLSTHSNPDIQDFWHQFFEKNSKDAFIALLTDGMNPETSIYSEDSVTRITEIYPDFNDNDSSYYDVDNKLQTKQNLQNTSAVNTDPIIKFAQSRLTKMITSSTGARTNAPSAILNMLLFIIGTSHQTWAIAASDEDQTGFADNLGIGIAMFETTASLGYYAATKAISKFMSKNMPSQLAKGTMYFKNYANFWLGVGNTNKVTSRISTRIANAIFSNSALGKFITKTSLILSVVSLGFGIKALVDAGYTGDVANIVFETLNVVVSTVGVIAGFGALIGAAFAGPLGLAVLAASAIIMIARWIYDATKPIYIDTPIKAFTLDVLNRHGYIFDEKGKFLSVVKDVRGFNYLQNTSLQTLELDSEDNGTLELRETVEYPRAIAISMNPYRYGVVYSFDRYINDNFDRARYQDYNLVCEQGFSKKLDWSGDSKINAVIAAVESTSRYSDSKALFWCKLSYQKTAVYMTDGLHISPKHQLTGFEDGDTDIQDIAAINDQYDTVLLIATKKNLYRVNNNYTVTKINSSALVDDQSNIQSVELLAAGDIAHLLLRFNPQNDPTLSQAQLFTVSSNGSYYDTIRESSFFQLNTDDSLVCRSAFLHDSTPCHDFVVVGPKGYKRMKAILDESRTKLISFGNGLDLPSIYPIGEAILLKNTYLNMAI
ncbi:hypothetical protein [Photobacterium leiognathi]|uniref:hypothetical protein n=1 Tax=Photobacterium leiognathi TaxID=553611 RepID=UPI0029823D1C|nr:hypothetical protein [Photobacterium leiognathi]